MALLFGVALLATGLLVTVGSITQEQQQRTALRRDAAQVSASFSSYFERARSIDLLLAQNQAVALTGPGIGLDAANRALQYLEVLYPDAIGEACLIDEQGRERARVTRGVPAPEAELSVNEAENPFFAPTLALGPGLVYQAPPYVSPDTGAWVISNSTWIRLPDGSRLIVHFEASLDSFAHNVGPTTPSRHFALVDRSNGRILLQDGTDLPPTTPAGRSPGPGSDRGIHMVQGFPATAWSTGFTKVSAAIGSTPVNGHWAAFRRIDRAAGNANDWYMAEWSTTRASLLPPLAGMVATALGLLLIFMALFALRRRERSLRATARLDHLTGLANRKALEEAFDKALDGASGRDGDGVGILMLDLDGFKQVNDALGHDKGDLILKEIARRLHANVFEHDTPARLGGDEFAVLLRRLHGAHDAAAVAHRLREALTRPIDIDGAPHFIGISIGAAVHPQHGLSFAELLRGADAAMYRAKRDREGIRLYDAGTPAGASDLGLAAELLMAIERDEIELAFQPEFSLSTGEIVGVEALARWERPGHGPVPPSEFIALAEKTGLIRSLTSLTLRRALDEAQSWHRHGVHVPVSVNLSGRVAADPSLPPEVSTLLAQRGLDSRALVLEIAHSGCDTGQGYHIARPMPSEAVRLLLGCGAAAPLPPPG